MNRRTSLKGLAVLASIGISSFSIFKWYESSKAIDPKELKSKRYLLAELAETIIPATDTPGAKAAGVHDYIIKVIINCSSKMEQQRFLSGIKELEVYVKSHYSRDFASCTSAEKVEILQYFADHDGYSYKILNKISNKLFGASFYIKLRNLTIEGFCMSRPGATEALVYDYIPGSFEACIPLKMHQKSWATK